MSNFVDEPRSLLLRGLKACPSACLTTCLGVALPFSPHTLNAQTEQLPDIALLEMLGEMEDAEGIGIDVDAMIEYKYLQQHGTEATPISDDSAGEKP